MLVKSGIDYSLIREFNQTSDFKDNTRWYSMNDFDIGIRNYSDLKGLEVNPRYSKHFQHLNWFAINTPALYLESIDTFASYLKYSILMNVFTNKSFIIADLENYFTDQLLSYMRTKGLIEKDSIKYLAKYTKNLRDEINHFYTKFKAFKHLQGSFECPFNNKVSVKDKYMFTLPAVMYNNVSEVQIELLLPYRGQVPNWFTIPSLFKVYSYFTNLDILVTHIHLNWYNLDSFFTKPKRITVPTTENVARLVSIYSDITPFPHPNLFALDSAYRYKITPVQTLIR